MSNNYPPNFTKQDEIEKGIEEPFEISDSTRAEIGRLISNGMTSGILFQDGNTRITWNLEINIF